MNIKVKTGIMNPFNLSKAHFDYEVIEDKNEVRTVTYEDYDGTNSYPEKDILIQALSGGGYRGNEFLVTLALDDALKVLRRKEIISLDLKFSVRKDENGKPVQKVYGDHLYTLNEYFQVREAESFYQGSISKKKEDSDK